MKADAPADPGLFIVSNQPLTFKLDRKSEDLVKYSQSERTCCHYRTAFKGIVPDAAMIAHVTAPSCNGRDSVTRLRHQPP